MNKSFLGIMIAAHALWAKCDLRGYRWAYLRGADLSEADLSGANLSEANLSEADLSGADLSGANLSEADLSGADLRWANLREANLRGADLSEADLSGADLRWANLREANLSGANRIIGPQRSDGYLFTYCTKTNRIHAGCRCMTIEEYREHIASYGDQSKRAETTAIIDCIEILARAAA